MIVTATHVRRAAMTLLQDRLPTVLESTAEAGGMPLPAPVTWKRLSDFTNIGEHQSPAVVVTTPGIDGRPAYFGGGESEVVWLVRAFCVVRGRDYEETADRVGLYTAALRSVFLSDPTLLGLAVAVDRRAETLAELRSDSSRTIGAGSVTVAYTITEDVEPGTPVTRIDLTTDLLPVVLRGP